MPQKHTYEVLVTAFKSYVVEAATKEEALDLVGEECSFLTGGWNIDAMRVECELKTPGQIRQVIRFGAEDARLGVDK